MEGSVRGLRSLPESASKKGSCLHVLSFLEDRTLLPQGAQGRHRPRSLVARGRGSQACSDSWGWCHPQHHPHIAPSKLQPHGGDFIVADLSNALKYM